MTTPDTPNAITAVAFDLIGVLAEPSWRELCPDPDLARWRRLRTGAIEEDDFWDSSCARAFRACLRLRADRLALIARLRARGLRIAVASNFARAWVASVRALLPDPGLVDAWCISGELGVAKPDPAFWRALAARMPGALVVDDQRRNVDAAAAAGLPAVWALPGADLEDRLLAALAAGPAGRTGAEAPQG